jgi:hypothetical protein
MYSCVDRPLSRLDGNHPAWTTAGHHMGTKTRGCKYSLELLMMSGVPLETCFKPSINFVIINFITSLHLVGYFY